MTTFFRDVPGQFDPATETTLPPTTTAISGSAIEKQPRSQLDIARYRDLSLVPIEAPLLFFIPDVYGELPKPGDRVEWAENGYVVREVQPLRPDGVVIGANVIISR